MGAGRALEPNIGSEDISDAGAPQLVSLVLDDGLSVREAWRITTAAGSFGASYSTAVLTIAQARAERRARDDASSIAGRMLTLVSKELEALEHSRKPTDLERLERLARTLGQIERLSPRSKKKKEAPAILGLIQETEGTEES